MKTYNSMYLGLCVNNNDPEFRGRVQVFVPHIMPALYDNWNKEGKDIQITCVGDNMTNGLDSQTLDKLKTILPWAEAASPILCGSSPGMVVRDTNGKAVLNQSPVLDGTAYDASNQQQESSSTPSNNEEELFKAAIEYAGPGELGDKVRANFAANGGLGSKRACARGVFAQIGAMTRDPNFPRNQTVGADAKDYAQGGKLSNSSANRLVSSGLYEKGEPIGGTVPPNPQIGWVIARGNHIQIYNGVRWVSDFSQRGVGGSGSNGMLYRMTPKGLAAVKLHSPGLYEQSLGTSAGKQTGALTYTDSSAKPPAAPAGPQYTANPVTASGIADSAAATPPSNTATGGSSEGAYTSDIATNGKQVNPLSFRDDVYNYILATNPAFLRNPPRGATAVGALIQGNNGVTKEQAAKSWADIIAKTAAAESGFNINSSNTRDPGGSYGIMQFSADHANKFYGNKAGINVRPELLNSDPGLGSRAFVGMVDYLAANNKSFYDGPGKKGAGGIFAAQTLDIVAANKNLTLEQALASGRRVSDYANLTKIGGNTAVILNTGNTLRNVTTGMVMNPDSGGLTPVTNTNNMPKGLFTYPAVGAMIWVFFREGNPLYPVYFAASYSASEWMGAYGNTSPAVGNPGESNPPGVATQATVFNTGAGGIIAKQTIDQNDQTQTSSSLALHGPGGQITFTDAKAYMYVRNDLRHQVEGALHESVLGFHEKLIQGDSNSVFLGARVVKIGNITPDAIAAAQELQTLLEEIQKPLSDTSAKPGEHGGKILNSNSIAQNVA